MAAPEVSRRSVLAGGAALAFLTACGGGDDGDGSPEGGGDRAPGTGELTGTLLGLLPPQGVLTTDGEQRVPVSIADAEGVPVTEGAEARVFRIQSDAGEPVEVEVEPHGDGVPAPYYPVRFTPTVAGIHELSIVGEDGFNTLTFDIAATAPIPGIGRALPPVATPTTEAARGVDPICTRTPPCDLHGVSLDEALRAGRPVALSISTPEFCQTTICGPVLDLLIEALPDFGSITGIHAEVYADPRGADDPTAGGLAPVTEQYGLPFEPTLYLVDSSGEVVERLDSVYDRAELSDALGRLA